MTYTVDNQGNQRWSTRLRTVPSFTDNAEHDIIDLTIEPNDNHDAGKVPVSSSADNNNGPVLEILGDSADNDASSFTMDHFLPREPEGDLEDTIMTDMPRSYGVQSFEEQTYYPDSNRTVNRFYNKQRQ